MKSLNRSPHYLIRNHHSFCFRVNVPKDLQRFVGKRELRYSLKTGYVGVARVKAQIIAAQVHQVFLCLRRGGRTLSDLTDERIQELVHQYLKESIEKLESRYYEEDPKATIQGREDFYRYLGELDSIKDDIIGYLGIGEYSTVEGIAIRILEQNGIEGIQKGSAEYVKLCRGLLRAQLQGIETEKKQMSSGLAEAPDSAPREQPLPSPPITFERSKGPLTSEVIDLYSKEAEPNWTPKTKDETLSSLRLFVEVVGDVPITSITRQRVGEFKQTLLKLPPNIKKSPLYRDKAIPEIIKMDVPKKMSSSTVSKH